MKIKGYAARDKDGTLALYLEKPERSKHGDYFYGGSFVELDSKEFADITWDGGARVVTLDVKR